MTVCWGTDQGWLERGRTPGWVPVDGGTDTAIAAGVIHRTSQAWCRPLVPGRTGPDAYAGPVEGLNRMRRLTRHRGFARLVSVRMVTQSGDAVVQVGMAAYVLLNPQSQTNAAAVALVVAIVMMPMAVVGPFVGPVLDRFARTSTVVACDLARCAMAVVMAVLVGMGATQNGWQVLLVVLLVVTLSLNRLQLAALGAGMPNTVDPDEYLEAASVMPMLGPLAMLVGGGAAAVIRLGLDAVPDTANAIVFGVAAALFGVGVSLMRGFSRRELGPAERSRGESVGSVLHGLRQAWSELVAARPALHGVLLVFASRAGYGLLMTMIVVLYRQYFPASGVQASVVSMGAWFGVTGLGFAASGLVAAPVIGRFGVRRTVIGALCATALIQIISGSVLTRPVLVACGLVIGLCVQSIKITADTLIQACISDDARGRVTLLHDIVNNSGYVAGAVVAALVLPANGHSIPVAVGLGLWFAVMAVWFWLVSRNDEAAYDAGTVRVGR